MIVETQTKIQFFISQDTAEGVLHLGNWITNRGLALPLFPIRSDRKCFLHNVPLTVLRNKSQQLFHSPSPSLFLSLSLTLYYYTPEYTVSALNIFFWKHCSRDREWKKRLFSKYGSEKNSDVSVDVHRLWTQKRIGPLWYIIPLALAFVFLFFLRLGKRKKKKKRIGGNHHSCMM